MSDTPGYKQLEEKIRTLEAETNHWKEEAARLRASEKRLSQIVQETSIPTFVIDKRHTVTHINKAYENLTGITADEIVGTNNQWRCFYPSRRPTMADLIVDEASEEEIHRYYGGRERKSLISEGGYEASALFRDLGSEPKWLFLRPLRSRMAMDTLPAPSKPSRILRSRKRLKTPSENQSGD
ncbi:MAG: PAS domain-containing protein [Deltaproteobacteria bacterium]|nr:PAS domain-containing protein [Deltaproteobacteria bacterium]